MEEKKTFGEYIRKKRLDINLTQKELAARLCVTESAVSKWERGLSYPDFFLVTDICETLGISEHEFFTACDDDKSRAQARDANTWRRVSRGSRRLLTISYAIALVVCFICDLAVFHTLDWFWIVFASLGLAFCITDLPFLVKGYRWEISMGAATGCLLLLLFTCWLYAGGWWIIGGMTITAACLVLPWGWWAIWRFVGKHVLLLSAALLSVWVFGLLAVIRAFTGGDWLLWMGVPMALTGAAFLWAYLICIVWLPVGPWLKAGACALITSFATPVFNGLCAFLLEDPTHPGFLDYFRWGSMLALRSAGNPNWVNVMVNNIMMAASVVLLAIGAGTEVRRRKQKK